MLPMGKEEVKELPVPQSNIYLLFISAPPVSIPIKYNRKQHCFQPFCSGREVPALTPEILGQRLEDHLSRT